MTARTRSRRGTYFLACSALVAAATPAIGAAPARPYCAVVAASPAFARDHVVFCVAPDPDGSPAAWVHRSANGGRTWTRGAMFATPNGDVGSITLAPNYPVDRSLYVGSSGGVWASHDDGRTLTKIAQRGNQGRAITPIPSGLPAPAASYQVAIVGGNALGASVYDPVTGVTRDALGAPAGNWHFIAPPAFAPTDQAVVLTFGPVVSDELGSLSAYGCTIGLQCTEQLARIGTPDFFPNVAHSLADRTHYVSGSLLHGGVRVFRSRDYGHSWQRWTSVENVVKKAYDSLDVFLQMDITASHDQPRRLWLNLGISSKSEASTIHPAFQLWRSDDGGTTWRRTAASWGVKQRAHGRNTLPWNAVSDRRVGTDATITAAPGNVLLTVGAHRGPRGVDYEGLYCSRDLGRTWRPYCF